MTRNSAPLAVQPSGASRPGGHYSYGMVHNGQLFGSGQLPTDPRTGRRLTGARNAPLFDATEPPSTPRLRRSGR